MSDPSKCGTYAGWNQHKTHGTDVCAACREAQRVYMKQWRRRTGRTKPHPAESILTDLIAELREVHPPEPGFIAGMVCGGGDCESGMPWPCATAEIADRAEARLKGLTDE